MGKDIGKIRQSAVIMNYGPGAIIDFRIPETGAPVSVVSTGLEQWEIMAEESEASIYNLKSFTEPRLAKKLGVSYFRQPPVHYDDPTDTQKNIPLLAVRFPTWLQCPNCEMIQPARRWQKDIINNSSLFCGVCASKEKSNKRIYVVPVRFITACKGGHLDEFPWYRWVHFGKSECGNDSKFFLRNNGSGLKGLILSCPSCKSERNLENIFSPDAHNHEHCNGRRFWITNESIQCNHQVLTVQRGASNLYFPILESALVIPPWTDQFIEQVGDLWDSIKNVERKQLDEYINYNWPTFSQRVPGIDKKDFKKIVVDKIDQEKKTDWENLRWDEFQQLTSNTRNYGEDFRIRQERDVENIPQIDHLVRVTSLKEIRAIRGFTRISTPNTDNVVQYQYLSKFKKNWLPAIEVKGEGIFISLKKEWLDSWLKKKEVLKHITKIKKFEESRIMNPNPKSGEFKYNPQLFARYVLLHSLAHVLIKQLSLQSGYSSASLRERIFVGDARYYMNGLLIYTSTSDSDGTMGGLQRQGKLNHFEHTLINGIRSNEWCSSDPLCINGNISASDAKNISACHSCIISPETSCEDYNGFLDRTLLVGTPEDRNMGFFSNLLV